MAGISKLFPKHRIYLIINCAQFRKDITWGTCVMLFLILQTKYAGSKFVVSKVEVYTETSLLILSLGI